MQDTTYTFPGFVDQVRALPYSEGPVGTVIPNRSTVAVPRPEDVAPAPLSLVSDSVSFPEIDVGVPTYSAAPVASMLVGAPMVAAMEPVYDVSPYAPGLPGVLQWLKHVYPDVYTEWKRRYPDVLKRVSAVNRVMEEAAVGGVIDLDWVPPCQAGGLSGLGQDGGDWWDSLMSAGQDLVDTVSQVADLYGQVQGISSQLNQQVSTATSGGTPKPLPNANTGQYPSSKPPSVASALGGLSTPVMIGIAAVGGFVLWKFL